MPKNSAKKTLILFDLDGVILDSRRNMQIAWEAVRGELGVDVPFHAYFAEIGRPFADIMDRLGLGLQTEAIEAVFRRTSQAALAETPLYPGAARMLEMLGEKNFRLGIVTSKDSIRTRFVLSRLPSVFTTVQTPDGVCRGKPAPDHLLMAMAVCQTDPSATVFVGDMDSDANAATRAGVDYIHAAWGYGDRPPTCIVSLDSCMDIVDYLGS